MINFRFRDGFALVDGGLLNLICDAIDDPAETPKGGITRNLSDILGDMLVATDVVKFPTDPNADCTAAINAAFQWFKASFVNRTTEDYVTRPLLFPARLYKCLASGGGINFTGLKARNAAILGFNAVFSCFGSANNALDMTGTRWLQIWGLTVFGEESNPPKCGMLYGPEYSGGVSVANGNNQFFGVNVTGTFGVTAGWNIGSETTKHWGTRFVNYNQDANAKSYIGDGAMKFGATSSYSTLRPANLGVSFTVNKFYGCEFRNMGGGSGLALEATNGWTFDEASYYISFNAACIQLYQRDVGRNQSIIIAGSFESAQVDNPVPGNTGVKYCVEIVGNGSNTDIAGFSLTAGIANYTDSFIKTTNTGTVSLRNAEIKINRPFKAGQGMFNGVNLSVTGTIRANCPNGGELNFNTLASFYGTVICRDATLIPTFPPGAYQIFSENGPILQKGAVTIV